MDKDTVKTVAKAAVVITGIVVTKLIIADAIQDAFKPPTPSK